MGKHKTKRKSSSAAEPTPGPKKVKKAPNTGGPTGRPEPTPLQDDSTFGQLVKQAGYDLMAGDFPNRLNVDQAMFQLNLTKALRRSGDLEEIIAQFNDGIQNHIEDPVRFKYSLLPTSTSADCESARGGSQDSLMRLLLGIDELQPSLINLLLEKLPEFMEDQDMFDSRDAANLPRLILNQFRWLDRVLNSEEMTSKMLEMVEVSSLSVQEEIISCIPEVVTDIEHNSVATKLQEFLLNSSQLTVPVLDALSNLNLTSDLMTEVRNAALQTVLSADLDDLPVIIKFILQSVNSSNAVEVIGQLRANLELPSSAASSPQSRGLLRHAGSSSRNRDNTLLILDAIKTSMRFEKVVTEGWIKAIENVHAANEHKVIDIMILLIAHTVAANRKKPLESLFRSKVRSGHFREELLEGAFNSHAQVIREYFPSIVSLAEVLLRSPEPVVSLFACSIYRQAFLAFDLNCKQEVIGSLVAHIGSGFEGEKAAGLDILLSLVEGHAGDVAPFAVFIKSVLDYLDNLSLPQIRKLFSILGVLAFRNTEDGSSSIQDELHIVIRKQLSSNSPKYNCIGVIGSLMMVRNMAARQKQDSTISKEMYKEVVSLLELVRSSSSKMPETSALFFDELANIMEQQLLDRKVEEWIGESILNDFQDDFVVDIEADQVSGDYGLQMSELYGLEAEESQGGVAINLLPLVSKAERAHLNFSALSTEESESSRPHPVSPLCMSPHFRLLRICEQVLNQGNLEDIDALLGCPLYAVNEDVLPKVASLAKHEKEMLCACLFLTLNWFREIVNAFSGLTDPEMRGKVLARLKSITQVQKHLRTCLAEIPNFNPPRATFDSDSLLTTNVTPHAPAPPAATGKRGRKPKEKKKDNTDKSRNLNETTNTCTGTLNTSLDTTQNRSTETESSETGPGDAGTVDLAQYRTYFRELDIDVFNILGCGLVNQSILDSDMNTKETIVLKLQPPELLFLLEDFSLKLDHALVASSSKRRTFLKTKTDKNAGFSHLDRFTPRVIAQKAVKLLPHLCDHLESTSAFFQALVAQNDGVIDGPGTHTAEYNEMASCLHLLLKSLFSIFSWNGFGSSEHRTLLVDALTVLATRIGGSGRRTQLSTKQLYKCSFNYLEKFSDTVPNLPSAVCLLRLLVTLSEQSDLTDTHKNIPEMSKGLLKRKWLGQDGLSEKGAKHNELLQAVLTIYLSHTPDVLESIENICTVGIPELMDSEGRNGFSTTYPTLNRNSFGSYYRIMLDKLVVCIRDMHRHTATQGVPSSQRNQQHQEQLIRWRMAVRIFHILISLIKAFYARNNLMTALKFARHFVELFLKHGMPLLDKLFPSHKDDVLALLKTLQQSTRSIHHMCSHSKGAKDVSLMKHVPAMKRGLEMFVYRVKAMLALHNCQDAFWLGNLKNRDLQGEEILSQQTNDSVSEDGDNEGDMELASGDSGSEDEDQSTTLGQEDRSDSDDDSCSTSY